MVGQSDVSTIQSTSIRSKLFILMIESTTKTTPLNWDKPWEIQNQRIEWVNLLSNIVYLCPKFRAQRKVGG